MHLILIGGKAGVGKTTLAKHIAEFAFNNGLRPKLMSFAGALKREAKSLGYGKEEQPEKYREYCQQVGRKKRLEDKDHWVKLFHHDLLSVMAEEIKLLKSGNKYWETLVIVDDCRYLNEVAYGKHHDAVQLFLMASDRTLPNNDADWRKDESEYLANIIEADDESDYAELFDWLVYNNDTLDALLQRVKKALPMWCGMEPHPSDDEDDETWLEIVESQDDIWEKMMDLFDKLEDGDDEET